MCKDEFALLSDFRQAKVKKIYRISILIMAAALIPTVLIPFVMLTLFIEALSTLAYILYLMLIAVFGTIVLHAIDNYRKQKVHIVVFENDPPPHRPDRMAATFKPKKRNNPEPKPFGIKKKP
jgi:hypothetical protein